MTVLSSVRIPTDCRWSRNEVDLGYFRWQALSGEGALVVALRVSFDAVP